MLHTGWSSTHCRLCSCRGGMDRWKYFHTGYASLATMTNGTDRQLCSYSYPSSHWIHVGRSMTGFCSCYRHRRGRLSMVCVFNYCVLESFMNHTHTHTCTHAQTHTHTHTHSCVSDYQPGSASPYSRWYSHSININITLDYPAASTISAKEHWHAIFV